MGESTSSTDYALNLGDRDYSYSCGLTKAETDLEAHTQMTILKHVNHDQERKLAVRLSLTVLLRAIQRAFFFLS